MSDPNQPTFRFMLPSPAATEDFARRIAQGLVAGDVVLLEGPLGVGKSHFARAAIRSLLPVDTRDQHVPSPSFTLVQTYDTRAGPVWHADLYRLNAPDEVLELGLTEAFEDAISLIEWPDRLGGVAPSHALRLSFCHSVDDDARAVTGTGPGRWPATLAGLVGEFGAVQAVSGCGSPLTGVRGAVPDVATGPAKGMAER